MNILNKIYSRFLVVYGFEMSKANSPFNQNLLLSSGTELRVSALPELEAAEYFLYQRICGGFGTR